MKGKWWLLGPGQRCELLPMCDQGSRRNEHDAIQQWWYLQKNPPRHDNLERLALFLRDTMSQYTVCGRKNTLFVTRSDQIVCAQCIEDLYGELEEKRDDLPPQEWALTPKGASGPPAVHIRTLTGSELAGSPCIAPYPEWGQNRSILVSGSLEAMLMPEPPSIIMSPSSIL